MTARNEPDGAGQQTAEKPSPKPEGGPQARGSGGLDLSDKVDQVGMILSKGLDLAEAGVSLGVTIVNRIGSAAQQQVLERMAAAMQQRDEPGAPPSPAMQGEGVPEAPAEPAAFYITNRLPLTPGGTVKVSFSINNDSMVAPKKVTLRIEGFQGEATGALLPAEGLSIKPETKSIAPVDFEKFVLSGAVPIETPPDAYFGWILVSSDDELRIPVRLTVSS